MFFGVFGICFLCNCIVALPFPSPCPGRGVWVCVGMEKPGSAMGREQVLEPLAAPSSWISPSLVFFGACALFVCPAASPAEGSTAVSPAAQGLGCHRLPAGWGARMGSQPHAGGQKKSRQWPGSAGGQGHPQSLPFLTLELRAGCPWPPGMGRVQLLHPSLLPGFPQMLAQHGWENLWLPGSGL